MALKGIKRAAAVVAAVATVGMGAVFVTPLSASAATQTSGYQPWWSDGAFFEAQVDNNPGNGAAAWLWHNDATHTDYYAVVTQVYYTDGSFAAWGPALNGTGVANLPKDVARFQVCKWQVGVNYGCSPWKWL
ncbi:hypothetical protein [Streptomyces sp. NPDC002159]